MYIIIILLMSMQHSAAALNSEFLQLVILKIVYSFQMHIQYRSKLFCIMLPLPYLQGEFPL